MSPVSNPLRRPTGDDGGFSGRDAVARDNVTRAIVTLLVSSACFATVGVFVRISGDVPVYEKVLLRSLMSLAFTAVVAARYGDNPFTSTRSRRTLLLRGAFGTAAMTLYFFAISHLALADAAILNKLSPFFVGAFAILFLGERPGRHFLPTLVLAFVGAALVIKPQFEMTPGPALAGFLSAAGSGAAYTVVRSLRRREPPYRIIFYFSLVSVAVMLPVTLAAPHPVSLKQALQLTLGAGGAAMAGQFLLTYAYHQAPATCISIYNYAHVLFALVLGLLLWGELPDELSLEGSALIVAAAVWNHRASRRDPGACGTS